MIFFPVIKSLILNPPPLIVWRNLLHYKISTFFKKTKVSHAPVSIVVYVTKRCNFKCSFCFTYGDLNQENWKEDELTIDQFQKIMDSEFGKKTLRIGFLGGEPFMNPLLFDFLEMAHQKGKITTIVTNASLVNEEHKKQLLRNHPTMLGISLYDNNRSQVASLSSWLAENKITFWVQTVINSASIDSMEPLLQFAHQYKINNLIFSNFHPSYSKEFHLVIYDDNEEFKIESRRIKAMAKKLGINLTLPQPIQRKPIKRTCSMAFSYVHADSSGNIGPCCFRAPKPEYGNIFSLATWNTPATQKIREPFIDHSIPPVSECNFCENFSRDLYGV